MVGDLSLDEAPVAAPGGGRLLAGIVVALLAATAALLGVFHAAEWYAGRVTLPRYCDDPQTALARVADILTEPRPADSEPMRGYVIAAKLIYLVPRRDGEPLEGYLARLGARIIESCR